METGNGVYVSIDGSGLNDIMLSLPVGNSNYTRPFPVSPSVSPFFWGESCILRKNDFYTLHVTKEKAVQLLSYGPHKRGGKDERKQFVGAKNAGIPIMTNLLKLEDQKSYFPLSLKITQWPLSFPS